MQKKNDSNKKILVVFDVDGTLLDTSEGIISSVKYTLYQFGKQDLEKEDLRAFIGPPIQRSFSKVYGLSKEQADAMALCFRQQYQGHDLLKAIPYDGIFDVFNELKRLEVGIAIATYKREDYAIALLEHYGFSKFTLNIHGADLAGRLSKADIIHKCISEANVADSTSVVMVGDTDNDAIGADELGIPFLGVTYGFGYRKSVDVICQNLVGVAEKPMDIVRILEGFRHADKSV